jgi:glycosyltransferase involved in cell wall biosynthesis
MWYEVQRSSRRPAVQELRREELRHHTPRYQDVITPRRAESSGNAVGRAAIRRSVRLPPPDPDLKVSVLIITYNVGEFVAAALDSVLMQEVNFNYEIVIGEDCSTDSTRRIVVEYAKRHPAKIRLLLREHNLGMNANFVQTLQACRGKYIALLDGDDYWTSRSKLQKQVDFLDSHSDCSICFHNVTVVYEDSSVEPHPFHMREPTRHHSTFIPKPISTLEDLVPGNFIQTGSVLYRAGLFAEIPEWFCDLPTYDWPLHVFNATYGKLGYLDEILGAYRVHRRGIWSMNMSFYNTIEDVERMIGAYDFINRHLSYRYDEIVKRSVPPLYYKAAEILYGAGRYREASDYAKRCLISPSPRYRRSRKFLITVMLKAYLPRLHGILKFLKATLRG